MSALLALFLFVRPEVVVDWLEAGRIAEAEKAIGEMAAARPQDAAVLYLQGNLRFLLGDYDGAVGKLREAVSRDKSNGAFKGLRDLVTATAEHTKDFAEQSSAHFQIRYPKGPEELLIPYALETLEAARTALAEDFGYAPEDKVRVEIYRDTSELAAVSTLSLQEIETSGTIALCKWNRLLLVSPRALVRGYSWLDTLAHEYTHFIVTRLSRNTVPIWLHEGIAKFEERRWRTSTGAPAERSAMTPVMEHLLATALKKERLITFAQMHPSMAKLPSQEDAALAFAEVLSAVEFLWKEKGWEGVRGVVEKMRDGASVEAAVAAAYGHPFAAWEKAWRAYLSAQKYRARPLLVPTRLRFRKGGEKADKDAEEDPATVLSAEKARRFARLAGLLRARGRTAAAVIEYEKAAAQLPGKEPLLSNKISRAYLELGQVDKARAAAEEALALYPELPGPHLTLAEIALRKSDPQAAKTHFLAALRQNPFDPSLHCGLAQVERGQPTGEREERACRRLQSP